jgi:E3 ubiquitin-protein ligase DOA10
MCQTPLGCFESLTELQCSTEASAQEQVAPVGTQMCRVCWSNDDQEDLVQPCDCSGSIQHIHAE